MKKHDLTQSINEVEGRWDRQLIALGAAIDLLTFILTTMNASGGEDGEVTWVTLVGDDLIKCCEKSGIKFASNERRAAFLETFNYNLMAAPLTSCDVWNIAHLLFHSEEHEDTVH